jgi:3-oxoacyl-[acyl-carrier protein] reductase
MDVFFQGNEKIFITNEKVEDYETGLNVLGAMNMMIENEKEQNILSGQVAIVTGGTGGIGRATCLTLASRGANIAVVDINSTFVNDLVSELHSRQYSPSPSQTTIGMTLDVGSEEDMENMAKRVLDEFGRIDILVHCAAILRGKGCGPRFLHQVSLQEWQEVVNTNLKGTFLSNRSVLPSMIQRRRGHIINFSSTSGLKGRAFDSVYCATKFGVIGLSEALAEEVRQYGIKVHVMMPDAVDTPIWDQNGPIRPPGDSLPPERVADLVGYLVSLPEDTILGNLVIFPFKIRRRKKQEKSQEYAESADANI